LQLEEIDAPFAANDVDPLAAQIVEEIVAVPADRQASDDVAGIDVVDEHDGR
jgi:hypothetical protein